MKIVFLLLLVGALASCSHAPSSPPEERTIPVVTIPTAPPAPDVAEVERSVQDLSMEVSDAREEVRAASAKVAEGVAESANLRDLIEREYQAAEVTAQAALENIRDAAGRTAAKLNQTVTLLNVASTRLADANKRTSELALQVSDLKSELAIQTSRIAEFREIASVANRRSEAATSQKDEFQNALATSVASATILTKERDKARGHRRTLLMTTGVLTIGLLGLTYLLFKP